jgi:glycosyltransferase involved in cell wall biosynthesis
VNRPYVPQPVLDAAHARSAARAARDWATADRLRDEIEAAGWRVVDSGVDFKLEPAHSVDVDTDGVTRYGRSAAVPSRFGEPATGLATVVLIATDQPDDLERAVRAIRTHCPNETQLVVVADGPSPDQEARLAALPEGVELTRTTQRLGWGAALNIGIRRATADVVVLLDTSIGPTGDIVTPLVDALREPDVAVAGPFGLRTTDFRRFDEISDGRDAAAIGGYVIAFRRSDAVTRGPVDEGFRFYQGLDIWWSFVLRDEGPDRPPRRAASVAGVPLLRHEDRGGSGLSKAERDRLAKRNFYRFLDRFRERRDLALGDGEASA